MIAATTVAGLVGSALWIAGAVCNHKFATVFGASLSVMMLVSAVVFAIAVRA